MWHVNKSIAWFYNIILDGGICSITSTHKHTYKYTNKSTQYAHMWTYNAVNVVFCFAIFRQQEASRRAAHKNKTSLTAIVWLLCISFREVWEWSVWWLPDTKVSKTKDDAMYNIFNLFAIIVVWSAFFSTKFFFFFFLIIFIFFLFCFNF